MKRTDPPNALSQTCEEPRDPNLENAENTSQMAEVEEFADNFLEVEPETPETNNLLLEDTKIRSTSRSNLSGQTTQTRRRGHSNFEVNAVLQRLAVVAEKSALCPRMQVI
jgi:murein L,D-transpeptidase YcbB/YkuD